tara:strand:+ start:2501 stop:2722 length:222 start_codon:yes stop_codon:yes gene_type:complete
MNLFAEKVILALLVGIHDKTLLTNLEDIQYALNMGREMLENPSVEEYYDSRIIRRMMNYLLLLKYKEKKESIW